jgi:hypothetical protein
MAASFLASFLIFFATGLYELFIGRADFLRDQPVIRVFVYGILFLNACYYYYFAAYTEMSETIRSKLSTASRLEWGIRVVNQTALFGLWFLLHFSWGWFGGGLVFVYLTYLLWDCVTYNQFSEHYLTWLDFFGFCLAIVFLFLKSRVEDTSIKDHTTIFFFLGVIAMAYMCLFYAGVKHCKFKPFGVVYRRRPFLH